MGEAVTEAFNGEKLAAKDSIDSINVLMKKNDPALGLLRGYIHVYDHYFQMPFSLKPQCQSKPNCMRSLLGKGERKYI